MIRRPLDFCWSGRRYLGHLRNYLHLFATTADATIHCNEVLLPGRQTATLMAFAVDEPGLVRHQYPPELLRRKG